MYVVQKNNENIFANFNYKKIKMDAKNHLQITNGFSTELPTNH